MKVGDVDTPFKRAVRAPEPASPILQCRRHVLMSDIDMTLNNLDVLTCARIKAYHGIIVHPRQLEAYPFEVPGLNRQQIDYCMESHWLHYVTDQIQLAHPTIPATFSRYADRFDYLIGTGAVKGSKEVTKHVHHWVAHNNIPVPPHHIHHVTGGSAKLTLKTQDGRPIDIYLDDDHTLGEKIVTANRAVEGLQERLDIPDEGADLLRAIILPERAWNRRFVEKHNPGRRNEGPVFSFTPDDYERQLPETFERAHAFISAVRDR